MTRPDNDPITSPEDSAAQADRKQNAGRGIVTFFIIFAAGAFAMYLFVIFYGAITGSN